MRAFYKSILSFFLIVVIILIYLSVFGIETNRFNEKISNNIKKINKKIEVELKEIKLILDPFKLNIKVKTLGSKIKSGDQIIDIENIKTQISIKSLFDDKLLIENLEVSTKSIELKKLISFLRIFHNSPELFILEKTLKNGYLIADINLEFDSEGKIKDNFSINGYVKDTKLSFLKNFNLEKLNLIFAYKKDKLSFQDISFVLNDLSFKSEKLLVKKINKDFEISGNILHKKLNFDKKNLELLIKPYLPKINMERLKFSSKNFFSFKLNDEFEFRDFEIESKIYINELEVINNFDLKEFLPKNKKSIIISENNLSIKYENGDLLINGKGNILLQENNDFIVYNLRKKKTDLNFKISLEIDKNPFLIKLLNYEKDNNKKTIIKIDGSKNQNNLITIDTFKLTELKNIIKISKLVINDKLEVTNLNEIDLNYIDRDKFLNSIKLKKIKNEYYLNGTLFNANGLIDNLLDNDDGTNRLNLNNKISIDIKKVYLDKEYGLSNFSGELILKGKDVQKADLIGFFSKDKKLKFTINSNGNDKITTLYVDKAKPIVNRYKFVKGFDKGSLDFYSSKKTGTNLSNSTLKIYDFKLKELPALTKLLTLASLQGIADILSGEGIRFDEFEMNFKNDRNSMTINEIYAIGPAISILMEGYVKKNQLISLKGTLVPATTINKFIGTIPVLGKILVGSKTGEGVFGVSFKIKGPPKNLETSVNPIKSLTPRFITRTLENIKKN